MLCALFALACVASSQAAVTLQQPNSAPLPVVLWHGMGDNCCNPASMGSIKKMIEKELGTGAYVVSLMIGSSPSEDTKNGFLLNVNTQVEMVCEQLAKDEKLKNGFNAIGFSQGAQFLRGYVERCNSPKVHNLISVGGQHQGVSGVPHCEGQGALCHQMRTLLGLGAYSPFVQQHLVQAEYWHDPSKEAEYREKCVFMPDINNDKDEKNATYKTNLQSLNKFVLIKFLKDTMVIPKESSWFGWYKEGSTDELVPLQETTLYKEDWLGLQSMDKAGQLDFLEVDADHLQVGTEWFMANIINKYLR